jgi:signal transduction histidine kinase
VRGFAATLKNLGDQLSATEKTEMIDRIDANARKLENLLGDLLDLDRLTREVITLNPEYRDVAEIVLGVAADPELAVGRTIQLNVEEAIAPVEASKIERIVENLISNAVRHTTAGTPIWVSVRNRPEGVLITVEDGGPGVPESIRSSIFEPFRQGSGVENSHSPGIGIGLSLVRAFAELHGGRTWVEDRVGGGARFNVLLPPDARSMSNPPTIDEEAQDLSPVPPMQSAWTDEAASAAVGTHSSRRS